TLQAALDWSYALLSQAEQAAFRTLAVFPGRFDLDAAQFVINRSESGVRPGDDGDGFDLLSLLVDKSLVFVDRSAEPSRYRLLSPGRQYAAERLADAGEEDAARDRHRDYFVAQASRWRSELYAITRVGRVLTDQADCLVALERSWQRGDVDAALCL